jgi:hypothetical protein
MKALITATALLLAFVGGAQGQDVATPGRRAPLANVEDLEPAVNVGAPRPPAVERPAVPQAPAATPPATPATPQASAERPAARVMDSLDLGTTSITGNAELPKVLYIVPWKKSDLGDLVGRPVNTLLDEVLAPVDPEVFQRHLSYYETLNGTKVEE